jgi:hypothetical protein
MATKWCVKLKLSNRLDKRAAELLAEMKGGKRGPISGTAVPEISARQRAATEAGFSSRELSAPPHRRGAEGRAGREGQGRSIRWAGFFGRSTARTARK